ncbi:MAG: hypothetical protein ACHQRJ_03595 [Alphaproteobacteria bacterium]
MKDRTADDRKGWRLRPSKAPRALKANANPRHGAETRRLLGKHYANKYGVRKG